jgi:alkanesulfonate monooxygenase SsuD/methylene tetrahydromethanopterin reductase-like flavin-dependent oxidoreductase (luciferase family)
MQLHADAGVDAVMDEARLADQQGFDSVWLFDHLMLHRGDDHLPDRPLDPFTLMTAVGAVTSNVRLGWATLNLNFRNPAVLAKMLTTLDQITHGRVICCIGSGWFPDECEAYNIPFQEEHGARMDYAREVIELWRELWTHPAPERVTYNGQHVRVHELPFNPAPYQQPHPPIWWGGDSDASLDMVKRYASGWMMITKANPEALRTELSAPDWPDRPMTLIKGGRVIAGATHAEAMAEAEAEFEVVRTSVSTQPIPTFEEFIAREIVGTPDECLDKLAEVASWGINYMRLSFRDLAAQERFARLILPRQSEIEERAPVAR